MIGITGATGQLGQLTIKNLREKVPADTIVSLVRSSEKAKQQNPEIEAREFNYDDPATLEHGLKGITTLFLISSSEVGKRLPQHTNVINAAKKVGVSHIVYTSILRADVAQLQLAEEHKATEQLIKESGIPYVILRNGWYSENYVQGVQAVIDSGVVAGAAGYGRIDTATRNDYAEAAAVVLNHASQHLGKVYELAGDASFTLQGYADAISAVTGKGIAYKPMTPDEYLTFLTDVAGIPEGFAAVLANSEQYAKEGELSGPSSTLHELIGRATPSITDLIKQAI